MSEWVSEWVTRSPIELSWTAKNIMVGGRDIHAQHSLRTFDLVQSKSQVSLNCSHTNCQVWEEGVTFNEFTNYKIQILCSNGSVWQVRLFDISEFPKRTSDSIALNFDANGDMGWIKRWHGLDKQRAGQYLQPVNQGQQLMCATPKYPSTRKRNPPLFCHSLQFHSFDKRFCSLFALCVNMG